MPVTFNDILKSSFLDSFNAITIFDMVITILTSFVLGLFIFFIYKKTYSGVMYSKTFGVSLIAMTMITAILILAVTSNVVLSLGMVGALSIVRFRTAIKEPYDIVFLFWAIAIGIIVAAGFIPLAFIGSALLGIILYVFSKIHTFEQPYILVLHLADSKVEPEIALILKEHTKKHSIKSKSISSDQIEINYEIRLQENESNFINLISDLEDVTNAILVSYNGDFIA